MSWDLWALNYDGPLDLDHFRDDRVHVLGACEDVRRSIDKCPANVVWNDARHGSIGGPGFAIEFSLNSREDTDEIGSLTFRVYGGGDPVSTIADLCKSAGWQVIDWTAGVFLNLENPSKSGWEHFQAFRDKVVERYGSPPPS